MRVCVLLCLGLGLGFLTGVGCSSDVFGFFEGLGVCEVRNSEILWVSWFEGDGR